MTSYSNRPKVRAHQVDADLVVSADDALALVDVVLAPQAVEAGRALAVEVVAWVALNLLDLALAFILTGLLSARVVGGRTGRAHELRSALTREVVDLKNVGFVTN